MKPWAEAAAEEASRTTGRTCRACGGLQPVRPWPSGRCPHCLEVPRPGPTRWRSWAKGLLALVATAVAAVALAVAAALLNS